MKRSGVFVAILVTALAANGARAATITVNTSAPSVGDDGFCSLVEAINSANTDAASGASPGECAAGSGADTIELAASVTYTLSSAFGDIGNGPNGLPVISSEIRINGHGSIIERAAMAPQFRILQVATAASLFLDSVTIRQGHAADSYLGGAGAHGGCIFTRGILFLGNSTVSQCQAGAGTGAGNGGSGGAIYAASSFLVLDHSSVTLSAAGDGISAGGHGGAIRAENEFVGIADSAILQNQAGSAQTFAGEGGGISAAQGVLELNRSAMSYNIAGSCNSNNPGGNGGGIAAGGTVVAILGTKISDNQAGGSNFVAGRGGGVFLYEGSLVATSSTFALNRTADGVDGTSGGFSGSGAGLFLESSTFAMTSCAIRNNVGGKGGDASGAGQYGGDGGSAAAFSATQSPGSLTGCDVANNSCGDGGDSAGSGGFGGPGGDGVILSDSELTIVDTTIRNNLSGKGGDAALGQGGSGGDGGGIRAEGVLFMQRSTLSDNAAGRGGNGAVAGDGGHGGGLSKPILAGTLANVTISGNAAGDGGNAQQPGNQGGSGGSGGGIYVGGGLNLLHVTLSDNRRGFGGTGMPTSGTLGSGGGIYVYNNTTTLANTIVANSAGEDCVVDSATVVLTGSNLIEDNSCGAVAGSDPQLAPLANYGGAIQTHALCTGVGNPDAACTGFSPAVNAGNDAACAAIEVGPTDERGATRKNGAHCDLGAYETVSTVPVIALDAAVRPSGIACVPVVLFGGNGSSTLTNQIDYDDNFFAFEEAQINPSIGPGTAAGKQVTQVQGGGNSELFTVSGGGGPIPDGLLYTAQIQVYSNAPLGTYPLTPTGGGSLMVTSCTGDCDGDGSTSIGEIQMCVNLFLGQPLCNLATAANCPIADENLNGEVSLGEVQQCVNYYLTGC